MAPRSILYISLRCLFVSALALQWTVTFFYPQEALSIAQAGQEPVLETTTKSQVFLGDTVSGDGIEEGIKIKADSSVGTNDILLLLLVLFIIVISALASWKNHDEGEKTSSAPRFGKLLARFGIL